MSACALCSAPLPEGGRFCPSCGSAVASGPGETTRTFAAGPHSRDLLDHGRFVPGTVLGGRYRITGIIGRGGMGEVYRADDLKLGQTVALKFLPESLAADGGKLARFHNEVRIARQISHPNVCRVYDIGEIEGLHYLTMEFVDGEDLAGLLRRIGRLPEDKAVEIARQLCAGLAAAHERGVLHRDLKPANVMIDGRGRVRITDFGLAGTTGSFQGADVSSGTPAYQAPEQRAGKEVSVRSDIYSLGLVLYETFTGRPAFAGSTPAELLRALDTSTPTSPSSFVRDLDPAVERAILRCVEREPRDRPSSALAVAAALPGGDPVAAALAAGETPSPEMIAAVRTDSAVQPLWAAVGLAFVLAGIVAVAALYDRVSIARVAPHEMPPEVLRARAEEILRTAGAGEARAAHRVVGFTNANEYLEWLLKAPRADWESFRAGLPAPVLFWYRQSPSRITPLDIHATRVGWRDPPLLPGGAAEVLLSTAGVLKTLHVVPPARQPLTAAQPFEWRPLLEAAGFDPARLRPVPPEWTPTEHVDTRAAWEGTYPGTNGPTMRIEAGSLAGKPLFFRVQGPWYEPDSAADSPAVLSIVLTVLLFAVAAALARRNLSLGRGDRRGAFRLALVLLGAYLLIWVLSNAGTRPSWNDLFAFSFGQPMAHAILHAALIWIAYLAVEPYVRKLWPRVMISWTRLMAWRWRDPLVGRDVLLGLAVGLASIALSALQYVVFPALGVPAPVPYAPPNLVGVGLTAPVGGLVGAITAAMTNPLLILILVLGLRGLFRRTWIALTVYVVLFTALAVSQIVQLEYARGTLLYACVDVLYALAVAFLLVRFGVLVTIAAEVARQLLQFPLTLDLGVWYAPAGVMAAVVLAGLAFYGFQVSRAGQPLWRADLVEGPAGSA